MQQRSFITLVIAVVVLGGIVSGVFAGGVAIGKSQGQEEANQELQEQFGQFPSGFDAENLPEGTSQPGEGAPAGMGGLGGRGGTTGTVDTIEGNTITLETSADTILVYLTDDTTIQKMTEGSLDDISPGDSITVTGEAGDDGAIEATNIMIVSGLVIE